MLIIGIAGGTGSGKTTVVRKIVDTLPANTVAVIPQDSYYNDQSDLPLEVRKKTNFDHPDAFEWPLLAHQIEELRQGRAIEQPTYSYLTCTRLPETVHVEPHDVIIVEGIMALYDKKLRDLMDLKIFVDAEPDERLLCVIESDIAERGHPLEMLIDKYRNESDKYPDAYKQDISKQLLWLESVLASAKEDWIIVAGHHPIYAYTPKEESERLDMQKRVDSILRKHNVDMYICGHIHNFQHIRVPGSDIDYVVNSAASLARKVEPIEGTKFCSPEPGFSVCSIDKKELNLRMIDKKGNVLYTVTRKK